MSSRFDRWQPALRRAVMKARPEYFAWPVEEQERYAVALPEEDHDPKVRPLRRKRKVVMARGVFDDLR